MMISGSVATQWSRTRSWRAVGVAELENCAVVVGAAEGLRMQKMLSDQGPKARTDSDSVNKAH